MNKITSKDIKALREYLDKMEALENEEPEKLTPEEWDEAWETIEKTGRIPKKYKGRITEREIEVRDGVEPLFDGNGKPLLDDEGNQRYRHVMYKKPHKSKAYTDTVWDEWNDRRNSLTKEYHDSIVKVFGNIKKDDEDKTLKELIEAAVSVPEVLDITNLPNLLPTDQRLQYAITPYRNEYAYILPFDYGQLRFDYDENGEIVIKTEAQFKAVEKAKDKESKIEAAGIDQPLLRQLFAATMKAYLCHYGNSITVYLPSFAREMNIDISGANKKAEAETKGENPGINHNANDFFKKLKALESLNGVWRGGSFYRVFVLEGYEAEQNTLTFSSPWLFKIARELLQNPANKKTKADGTTIWEITGISSLMKPSIVSARSKPTVEILATLLAGLKQYGTKPEAKRHPRKKYRDKELVVYPISFKTLIERIPLIMENLDACKPSNKTTLLQRYFCGSNFKKRQKEGKGFILEEYIREHTFIMDYYKDFEIEFRPPTVKTLSDKIIIRHRGINGDFMANNSLNEFLFREMPQEESVAPPEE